MIYHHEKINISFTRNKMSIVALKLCISITFVINKLSPKKIQTSIGIAIKKKFGDDNIVGFNFKNHAK